MEDEMICAECAAPVALVERGGNFIVVDYADRADRGARRHDCPML